MNPERGFHFAPASKVWDTLRVGFEKVASYFVKIATTCTAAVSRETPTAGSEDELKSTPQGVFFNYVRGEQRKGFLTAGADEKDLVLQGHFT